EADQIDPYAAPSVQSSAPQAPTASAQDASTVRSKGDAQATQGNTGVTSVPDQYKRLYPQGVYCLSKKAPAHEFKGKDAKGGRDGKVEKAESRAAGQGGVAE